MNFLTKLDDQFNAHLIPRVALVVAGVAATDGDDLVERLGGEVGYEGAVLQPSVLWLRVAWEWREGTDE